MRHITEGATRASAAEYIRRRLGEGKSLANALLKAVDLERGEITILSPNQLSPQEMTQFDWGHARPSDARSENIRMGNVSYVAVPKTTADAKLVEIIYDMMQCPGCTCVMEEALAEPHDAWPQRARSRIITNGNEVYYALLSADRDEATIELAMREDRSFVRIGAVGQVSAADSTRIASEGKITKGQLELLAATARCIFVGAYDGEGHLIWQNPCRDIL